MIGKLAIAAVTFQVLVLAYMAGERELVVRTGHTVYLRTAPIDPRDVMRGDYVRLNYEISTVPQSMLRDGLASKKPDPESEKDTRVYALLREADNGIVELVGLSDKRPAKGLYIRGRLEPSWGGGTRVRYGLEAYFTEQGKALALEQAGSRSGIQIPLEMEVAVSQNGLAVIKGHRRRPLGIGLEVEMVTRGTQRIAVAAKVRLMNTGTNDLAIVDLAGGRSLALVYASFDEPMWIWSPPVESSNPKPSEVIVLKPGAEHTIRARLDDERWRVTQAHANDGEAKKQLLLSDLRQEPTTRFRFEYRPPSPEKCAGLPNGNLVWQGSLKTRAFSPAGWTD